MKTRVLGSVIYAQTLGNNLFKNTEGRSFMRAKRFNLIPVSLRAKRGNFVKTYAFFPYGIAAFHSQ